MNGKQTMVFTIYIFSILSYDGINVNITTTVMQSKARYKSNLGLIENIFKSPINIRQKKRTIINHTPGNKEV